MEKLIGLSQVQATEIRSLIAVLPTIEVAQHLIERYFKLWGKSSFQKSVKRANLATFPRLESVSLVGFACLSDRLAKVLHERN